MRRQSRILSSLPLLFALALLCNLGCARRPTGPAFDVPALIGQKLPGVEKSLGAGQPEAESANAESGVTDFIRSEYVLRVEYLKRNGRVTALTFSYTDPNQSIKEDNKEELLSAAGLKEDDARYGIETIEDPQKALYISGVRVTPAPVQHKVELRVKGSSMVSVRYTSPPRSASEAPVGDTTAPGQAFMTLPPWNTVFTAPTGTVVSIEAGPLQMPTSSEAGGYATTTVQIIADGKVIQQFTSDGGTAHCEAELD